jgi:hypothetical protein
MNVISSMFFEKSKCVVELVEKNVEGTCNHACSFEHVQNFHMHFLDYKILPHHFHLSIHVRYLEPNLQCHVEIFIKKKFNHILYIAVMWHY